MEYTIRGHHLESEISNINYNRNSIFLKYLENNSDATIILNDQYDSFCSEVCNLSCDDLKENLPNWDKAFLELNGFFVGEKIKAKDLSLKILKLAQERNSFGDQNILMDEGQEMSFDDIKKFLGKTYFSNS